MFIIDFDDTLFNTQKFKEQRERALSNVGVSKQMYDQTYKNARVDNNGLYNYTDYRHAEILSECGFDYDQILDAFNNVMAQDNLKNLLFEDTKLFLDFIKKRDSKMILLSLGSHDFQKIKSQGSGILDYFDFDDIYFVQDDKKNIISEILKNSKNNNYNQNIWFINDKIKETKEIQEKFPELKAIIKSNNNNFVKIIDYIKKYEN